MTTIEPGPPDAGQRATGAAAADALADARAAVEPLEQMLDMAPLDHRQRLLLVHAHPDDEAIGTGATMAHYAATGALVTLVTCTLGEHGEIVVDDLAHLASDRDGGLGEHRRGELAAACEALGVTDHRLLGGPGRWRDSGMMGTPTNEAPDCFWRADLGQATAELVAVVREARPQVVVGYDENGGYGHPDHIQAHRVAVAAFAAAADPDYHRELGEPWAPSKLYYTAVPRSVLQAGIEMFAAAGESLFDGVTSADELPFGVPDEQITTEVDASAELAAKMAALRAHRSQISVQSPFFALSDNRGRAAFGREHYVLVRGARGQPGAGGWESDLFDGIEEPG